MYDARVFVGHLLIHSNIEYLFSVGHTVVYMTHDLYAYYVLSKVSVARGSLNKLDGRLNSPFITELCASPCPGRWMKEQSLPSKLTVGLAT